MTPLDTSLPSNLYANQTTWTLLKSLHAEGSFKLTLKGYELTLASSALHLEVCNFDTQYGGMVTTKDKIPWGNVLDCVKFGGPLLRYLIVRPESVTIIRNTSPEPQRITDSTIAEKIEAGGPNMICALAPYGLYIYEKTWDQLLAPRNAPI